MHSLFVVFLLTLNHSQIPKNFFLWHASCSRDNRHARETKVKSKRAPAATFPLSAASRCASHPPSNPSVLPPEIGTQSVMTGFSCLEDSIFRTLRVLLAFA